MKQYIDKDALMAEIERRIDEVNQIGKASYEVGLFDAYKIILSFIDTFDVKEVEEEAVSNDLEEAIKKYLKSLRKSHFEGYDIERAFKKGAQWQKEQMEKNRIEHCDNITEEQYNLETGFLDDFLDKNKRMPTFLDAIEYGMQKAQKGE